MVSLRASTNRLAFEEVDVTTLPRLCGPGALSHHGTSRVGRRRRRPDIRKTAASPGAGRAPARPDDVSRSKQTNADPSRPTQNLSRPAQPLGRAGSALRPGAGSRGRRVESARPGIVPGMPRDVSQLPGFFYMRHDVSPDIR